MSGFFRRGKAVKKPGVHLLVQRIIQLPGQLIDIAKPQIERHPPAVEQQTMHPPKADGHCACSCCAHGASSGQRWCARRRSSAFSGYFSKLMKCNLCKVTSGLSRTKNVKRLPEGEEIEPGAEAALRDDHQRARVAGEALRQAISAEKKRSESLPDRCHWKSKHRRNLGKQVYPQR